MNVNHLDPLFLSNRHSFEIARLLLEHVFADWTYKKLILIGAQEINVKYNNRSFTASSSSLEVRRYLVTTLYQLLTRKKEIFIEELSDFTKNNEYHYQLQQNIRVVNDILVLLDKMEFHDDVIYYMTILT
jgi:DNA-binding transcriptional regulator WhiA